VIIRRHEVVLRPFVLEQELQHIGLSRGLERVLADGHPAIRRDDG